MIQNQEQIYNIYIYIYFFLCVFFVLFFFFLWEERNVWGIRSFSSLSESLLRILKSRALVILVGYFCY